MKSHIMCRNARRKKHTCVEFRTSDNRGPRFFFLSFFHSYTLGTYIRYYQLLRWGHFSKNFRYFFSWCCLQKAFLLTLVSRHLAHAMGYSEIGDFIRVDASFYIVPRNDCEHATSSTYVSYSRTRYNIRMVYVPRLSIYTTFCTTYTLHGPNISHLQNIISRRYTH